MAVRPGADTGPWGGVTLAGYVVVALLLILPLAGVFRFSFLDPETGVLSLGNYREAFSDRLGSTTTSSCDQSASPLSASSTQRRISPSRSANT